MESITLKNLGEKSEQEVFDYVTDHLLIQNQKSFNETRSCSYRGINNLKCAAGCLITKEEYSPEMENKSWNQLVEFDMVPPQNKELITELQLLHDNNHQVFWKSLLLELSKARNLVWNF